AAERRCWLMAAQDLRDYQAGKEQLDQAPSAESAARQNAAGAASTRTLGFSVEVEIKGSVIKHSGRLPLAGTYDDLRRRAVDFVHRTWPLTEGKPVHRIVWQP